MRWLTAAWLVPLLTGCSFIYNPNNLPNPPGEAGIDAAPDASIVRDANECMLSLTDITPAVLNEGQGDGNSAPGLFVVRGHNIVNKNLQVVLNPPMGVMVKVDPVTNPLASHDGDYLAFQVTAHVDTSLATDVALDVVVTQDGSQALGCASDTQMLAAALTLHGLPELTSASSEVKNKVLTVSGMPSTLYSKIDLSDVTPLSFALAGGATYAELQAVSSIALAAVAADASSTTAGPGGNAGSTAAGACAVTGGGGGRGVDATLGQLIKSGGGGGGGGGSTKGGAGTAGTGGDAGAAGIQNGTDQLASLTNNAACAGGGGGNGGLLGASGTPGAGGGGGGTVVIATGGDVTATSISAKGGAGGGGSGGGGSGGGGAGGDVLIRTDTGTLTAPAINVSAGAGGSAAPSGGTGSVGRVRWDAPDGNALAGTRRGPAFGRLTSRVFTSQPSAIPLVGTSGDGVSFRVIDQGNTSHDGSHTSFTGAGAVISPTLFPGVNQVCIDLDNGTKQTIEGERCIALVLLP